MRTAETVLTVIRERGKQGLPLERVYRLLFKQDLYLRAYSRLYPNQGAMTPGSTSETVDGMSLAKIDQLIDDIKHERHRWTPARRTNIPKRNGKQRPLGIPTWRDKLLQEVIRSILEAYYEPQFSDHSHGFRPGRGCHTALREIQSTWTGTRWFIEGDIASYFDTINHDILISILSEKLLDGRFIRLIHNLLQAGYLEEWHYHRTYSGTPQGGVVSPILANIYLDQFDQWVKHTLIPANTRGDERAGNPRYAALSTRIATRRKLGRHEEAQALNKERRMLPSKDPNDPNYRRLRYIRYADDFVLGFAGPRHDAEAIKRAIGEFLHSKLDLKLSEEKTFITHATTAPARFLGYHISTQLRNDKHNYGRRAVNGVIALHVPNAVIEQKCAEYQKDGKPASRPALIADDDYSIMVRYQQEYRGVVQYYQLAQNVSAFWKLHWVAQTSLLRTLAKKHRSTTTKMAERYQAQTTTTDGTTLKCLELRVEREGKPPLVARFGGISLKRQPWAELDDRLFVPRRAERNEIITRLLADECELCGTHDDVEAHHIRKLADLQRKGGRERPYWARIMAMRRRKSLMVCRYCHEAIHAGRPTRQKTQT